MTITSRQNPLIKSVRRLCQKKVRDDENTFIIEGTKLFIEACRWQQTFQTILYTEAWVCNADEEIQAAFDTLRKAAVIHQVEESVFQSLSQQKHPEGILAVLTQMSPPDMPTFPDEFSKNFKKDCQKEQKYVILENVQDPGNVGTIIRTADAAGYDGVVLTAGCADLYNNKVIRAAMGSIFHLPILKAKNISEALTVFKARQIALIGASLKGEEKINKPVRQSFALILGNESKGLLPETETCCDHLVKIPIYGHAESLNVAVAAGILMYHL